MYISMSWEVAYFIVAAASFIPMFIMYVIIQGDDFDMFSAGLITGVSPFIWPISLPVFIIILALKVGKGREVSQ